MKIGEFYWCYSWTKGKLFFGDGVNKFGNDYRIEQRGDDKHIWTKGYWLRKGGQLSVAWWLEYGA